MNLSGVELAVLDYLKENGATLGNLCGLEEDFAGGLHRVVDGTRSGRDVLRERWSAAQRLVSCGLLRLKVKHESLAADSWSAFHERLMNLGAGKLHPDVRRCVVELTADGYRVWECYSRPTWQEWWTYEDYASRDSYRVPSQYRDELIVWGGSEDALAIGKEFLSERLMGETPWGFEELMSGSSEGVELNEFKTLSIGFWARIGVRQGSQFFGMIAPEGDREFAARCGDLWKRPGHCWRERGFDSTARHPETTLDFAIEVDVLKS